MYPRLFVSLLVLLHVLFRFHLRLVRSVYHSFRWNPEPLRYGARAVCESLREEGVLAKDTHDHTIRIAPPLVITADEVDWALERFDKVLTRLG